MFQEPIKENVFELCVWETRAQQRLFEIVPIRIYAGQISSTGLDWSQGDLFTEIICDYFTQLLGKEYKHLLGTEF